MIIETVMYVRNAKLDMYGYAALAGMISTPPLLLCRVVSNAQIIYTMELGPLGDWCH
jgi:hypothetical protein